MRNVAASIENNFINGYVTEATALNFPEAACTATENCIFTLKGNVTRRLGIDFEVNHQFNTADRTNKAVSQFYWKSAGGSGDNNLIVKQVGPTLYFYTVGFDTLSSQEFAKVSLLPFLAPGAPDPSTKECQFAFGHGYLFVTHPYLDPFYIAYDPPTQTLDAESISIQIRDFDGVQDEFNYDPGFRPPQSSNTSKYRYNIYNKGWAPFDPGGVTTLILPGMIVKNAPYPQPPSPNYIGDPFRTWMENRTDLPSYSDVWWLFKDSMEQFQPRLASGQAIGNSVSPKGHYIMDAFYQDRSAASGIPGLDVVSTGYNRPQTVAFYAGRVFFAGVNAQGFSNKIYFSQIIRTKQEFNKCYQVNDPTSEHLFNLLATDGGEINILDCGTIYKMVAMQTSLVLFASNGVWAISGSSGIGFTANDFTVRKISSIPTLSGNSFVDVAGAPAWWNTDGIYMISGSDAMGQIQITSLTEKKIKTYYTTEIPSDNKHYVVGDFNNVTKVIQWVFRSTTMSSIQDRYDYDSILCFNTITKAFYLWSLPSGSIKLNGIVAIQGASTSTSLEAVLTNSGDIVKSVSGDTVVSTVTASVYTASTFKYLVSMPNGSSYNFTWAEESDTGYLDFKSFDGVGQDYVSYIVTGFKVHGTGQKKFQSNYLFIYCDNSVPVKFYFSSVWDYANDPVTGDIGTQQYIEFTNPLRNLDRDYVVARKKVRGSGLALQFKFSSVSGEQFNITGWSGFETGNATI